MNFENLPESWKVVRLGRVVSEVTSGFALNKKFHVDRDKGIPHLRPHNIGLDGSVNLDGVAYVPHIPRYDYIFPKRGEVLFNNTNSQELVGKTAFVSKDMKAYYSNHITKLKPNDLINGLFLSFYLRYLHSMGYFSSICSRWIGQAGISTQKLVNIQIPLPPLPEQKRIVEILSLAEELIRKQKEAIALIDKILMAKFLEMFGDPATNPKGWEVRRLGEVAEVIMGQSPPSSSYNKEGRGIPFLQGKAEFGEYYPTPVKWCDSPLKIATNGDILLSVRAPVGDVNICPFDICIGRGLAAIKPKSGVSDTWFLFFLMKKLKAEIEGLSGGSTFQAITKSDIENFLIPLPPIELQCEFARIVEEFEKKREEMQRTLKTLESLFKLLQKKAFTGELTAEWREQNKVEWETPQITERQAVLLASIYYHQNIIQKPALITMAMKSAFLLQQEAGLNLGYEFIPYKYGPFSKEVYEDIEELEKNMLVERIKPKKDVEMMEIKLVDEFRDWSEKIINSLPKDTLKVIKEYVERFGKMSLDELLEYVYAKYPEYTAKSKRKGRRK